MLGIYCRTSKFREEKYTIENQRDGGLECASRLAVDYKFYIDDGISGTLDETVRDGLADLLRDIRRGEITHVYCIDQSRIERNTRTWDFFVAECINNNVTYLPSGIVADLSDSNFQMFAKMMSLVNAYYAEITSKKVRLANAKKAKEGRTHGLIPYGYKRGKDKKYEIDEAEAQNVRRMFKLSLEGVGSYSIANIFNDEKIPTKFSKNFTGRITRKDKYTKKKTYFEKSEVKWRGNVIYDMIVNPIYKGVREWNRYEDKPLIENGKVKKVKVIAETILYQDAPIIIEPELWEKVNKNLAENKKNVGKKAQYNYLLNGLISCSHCQNEVIGKKRLKGRDNAYKCKGKRPPHKNCDSSRGISLPKLETFIIQHLFHSKELKALLANAPKNLNESLRIRKVLDELEIKRIEISKGVERNFKLLQYPDLADDEAFIKEYLTCKEKLKLVEEQIDNNKRNLALVENEKRNERVKSTIEQYTSDIEFAEIKRLVHSLIENIEIKHVKEDRSGYYIVKIKYRFYEEESVFSTNWQALNWQWLSYYRGTAISKSNFEEDNELFKYLTGTEASESFVGFESVTKEHKTIALNAEQLIKFDYV